MPTRGRSGKDKERQAEETAQGEAALAASGTRGGEPSLGGPSEELSALTASVQQLLGKLSEQQEAISTLQAAMAARERSPPQEGGGQASEQGDGGGRHPVTPDSSGGAAESAPVTLADLRELLEGQQQPKQRWLKVEFSERFDGDIAKLPRWSQEALSYLEMHKGDPATKAWFLANRIGKDSLQSQVKLALMERPLAERTPLTVLRLLRLALGVDAHTAAMEAALKWAVCRQRAGESVADFAVRYKDALLQGQPDLQPALQGQFASLMFMVRLRPALMGAVAASHHDVCTLEAAIAAATREEYHLEKRQLQEQRRTVGGRPGRVAGLSAMGAQEAPAGSEELADWQDDDEEPDDEANLAAMQYGSSGSRGRGSQGGGGGRSTRGGRGGGRGRGSGPAGLPESTETVPGTDGVVHPNVDCRKCKAWGHYRSKCPRGTGGGVAARQQGN